MNSFAPFQPIYGCFIVENIANPAKVVRIFQYPVLTGGTRNLLEVPGVGEGEIRASLLKGELNRKIRANEIQVLCNDTDLLQFNADQKAFLQAAGITNGLDVSGAGGITADDHERLHQLIHFLGDAGGPAHGFASGAVKVIVGQPFPTSITWYVDGTQTTKIIEKRIVYNVSNFPITTTWDVYEDDGITIAQTVVDSITYTNNAFETQRIRTIL